jgi:transcription termination/antitermination protein NusG
MNVAVHHDRPTWYAVSTRSRQEKVAASMMEYMGIPNFLPLLSRVRRWSDRKQMVDLPLFPSYVFVRIARSSELQLRVLKISGVVGFVRNQTGPLPIQDREIEDVRAALSHGIGCSPCAFLKAGDCVRVVRGALAGVEGTLIRCGSQSKLVISVEMIRRAVAVSVNESDVEPAYRESKRETQSLSSYLTAPGHVY